jgi:hypothetical protein
MRKRTSLATLLINIAIVLVAQLRTPVQTAETSGTQDPSFENIVSVLKAIENGRASLEQLKGYGVKVVVKFDECSSYHASDHTIVIDVSLSPERGALTFIHEMNHAQYHLGG